ncbi:MAG: hypothetical protein GY832_03940 [Chloroflexi bacterium]|nr:hypothetical protein [Chloroflexota bacterium]
MVLLVDPLTAHVMGQALRGECPPADVVFVTVWKIGGWLVGVLLAGGAGGIGGGSRLASDLRWYRQSDASRLSVGAQDQAVAQGGAIL